MCNNSMTSYERPHWLPENWADWRFPTPQAIEEQLKREFPDKDRAEAWGEAAQAIKTYHDELMDQWQKAMDSVLVYAGLFSAVLTAFNVESYQLLQAAPTDPMLATLQQISAQLNSFSINPSFINSTQPARPPDQLLPTFRAPVSAVWINSMWFASLACSLASASIALMVKQWLYEASQDLSGNSRDTARRRQYRLNNLVKWKVGEIVVIPSVLLQVALFLYLAGLITLLWTIHQTVAVVITALVSVLFVFVFGITALPIFRSDCCYRSPQAKGLFALGRAVWNNVGLHAIGFIVATVTKRHPLSRLLHYLSTAATKVLSTVKSTLVSLLSNGICWPEHLKLKSFSAASFSDVSIFLQKEMPTWNGAEETEVAKENGVLDHHIIKMAYTISFNTIKHPETLHLLLSDLPRSHVFPCFSDICSYWSRLKVSDTEKDRTHLGGIAEKFCGETLYCTILKALTAPETDPALVESWANLAVQSVSLQKASTNLPLSGECLSALALTSIGESSLADFAFLLLNHRFYDAASWKSVSLQEDFVVTFEVLQNVMALARYNVAQWKPCDEYKGVHKLSIVYISLEYTERFLTSDDKTIQAFDQESWVRSETENLLYCLARKLVEIEWNPTEFSPLDQFASKMFKQLVNLATCAKIEGGHRLVPDLLLSGSIQPGVRELPQGLEALITSMEDTQLTASGLSQARIREVRQFVSSGHEWWIDLRSAIRRRKQEEKRRLPPNSSSRTS